MRKNCRHSNLVDIRVIETMKNPFAKDWKFLTLVVPWSSQPQPSQGITNCRTYSKKSAFPFTRVNISRNLAAFSSHLTMKTM